MNFIQQSIVTGRPVKEIEKEHLKKTQPNNNQVAARTAELERLFGKGEVFTVGDKK